MKHLLLLPYLLLAALTAGAQRAWTLQECMDTAARRHATVRAAGLRADAAAVAYRQSRDNLLPQVSGSISHGINQGRSIDPFTNTYVNRQISFSNYGLGASALLFNGGALRQAAAGNRLAHDAARMEQAAAEDNIALEVMLAFLGVLNAEDQLERARKAAEVARAQVARLQVLDREGAIPPPQLQELTGQWKSDELAAAGAEYDLAGARLLLTQLMNVPFDPSLRLSREGIGEALVPPSGTAEEVFNKASGGLAAVQAASLYRQSAEAAIRAAKGALYPSLFLNGNLNTTYSSAAAREVAGTPVEVATKDFVVVNGSRVPVYTLQQNAAMERIGYTAQLKNNIFSGVGLGVRIPILNGRAARNSISLARIELQTRDLARTELLRQLRQDVEAAHLLQENAWARFRLSTEQVAAFREAFRAAEVRLNNGVGSSVEYLVAKGNLDRALAGQVLARYDYLLRSRILLFYGQGGWAAK